MIPSTWKEHRRQDDDELLGYIVPTDEAFQARTVFGYPVGAVSDQQHAEQIVEATPSKVTVKSVVYGYEGDYGTAFTLDVPIQPDRLRPGRTLA